MDKSPMQLDLVGAAGLPAAFLQIDSNFVYLRERILDDPSGPGGFASQSWVVLVQVAGGDPFKYQWLISVNGGGEHVELWENNPATDNISFSPIFSDDAETTVFSGSTGTLARIVPAGSTIGGMSNYFVDWAMPRTQLDPRGIDPNTSLYWFATSANSNNFNKDTLSCPFTPVTTLALSKAVVPSTISPSVSTPVTYTIGVTNTGIHAASGVAISDTAFPAWLAITSVTTTAGSATFTSSNFSVTISSLGIGASATITVNATATPPGEQTFTNTVSGYATNAANTTAMASLVVVEPTNTPTRTPTSTATDTATQTPTWSFTVPPSATATWSATAAASQTATATHTAVPTDTAIPTETATATATETPSAMTTASPEATASATDSPVPTSTPTTTQTAVATDTQTPTETAAAVATDTPVGPTHSPTGTPTAAPTGTSTPTQEPTSTSTPRGVCEQVPATGCRRPLKANKRTLFVRLDGALPKKNRFTYEWRRGDAIPGDFGQPDVTGGTVLSFCVYHGLQQVRVVGFDIAPGGTCDGKPCWKKRTTGNGLTTFRYKNANKDEDVVDGPGPGNPFGVLKTRLREGLSAQPPDARMIVKAKAAKIPAQSLPAGSGGEMFNLPVLVQVQAHDETSGMLLPVCWESEYSGTNGQVKVNSAKKFKASNDPPLP